ncbi:hypothetical protein F5883DRAFT_80033 [Diaporthe sp. PMI_573]|nr:hypothetical protein F5883DRAFT_80033 [Diaporthaceae sp. PMI_573]
MPLRAVKFWPSSSLYQLQCLSLLVDTGSAFRLKQWTRLGSRRKKLVLRCIGLAADTVALVSILGRGERLSGLVSTFKVCTSLRVSSNAHSL